MRSPLIAFKTGGATQLHFLAIQRPVGILLGIHLQNRARNEKQDVWRNFGSISPQWSVKHHSFSFTLPHSATRLPLLFFFQTNITLIDEGLLLSFFPGCWTFIVYLHLRRCLPLSPMSPVSYAPFTYLHFLHWLWMHDCAVCFVSLFFCSPTKLFLFILFSNLCFYSFILLCWYILPL